MKRTLIALGVAATVALPVTAQAGFKVYGKLNVGVEKYETETNGVATLDQIRMQSYASRFGVKGEDELTANLSAVYGIEWEVAADGNSVTDLGQRVRYVGIKHVDFGTLKLGRIDTNLKTAQGKVDLFNDTTLDMNTIVAGETRANNVIAYESPKIVDALSINLQLIPGEASGIPGATPAATATNSYNGIADAISASIVYENADLGLYLALARDQEMAGNNNMLSTAATGGANTGRRDTTRLVAGYKIADLSLGALYQISEGVNDAAIGVVPAAAAEEETSWLLSVAYKIADVTLKAQYVAGENDATVANERTQWGAGADYNFTSKTKAFAYYGAYENDTGVVATSGEAKVLALGLEHSF